MDTWDAAPLSPGKPPCRLRRGRGQSESNGFICGQVVTPTGSIATAGAKCIDCVRENTVFLLKYTVRGCGRLSPAHSSLLTARSSVVTGAFHSVRVSSEMFCVLLTVRAVLCRVIHSTAGKRANRHNTAGDTLQWRAPRCPPPRDTFTQLNASDFLNTLLKAVISGTKFYVWVTDEAVLLGWTGSKNLVQGGT